jgi:hypothetical protein
LAHTRRSTNSYLSIKFISQYVCSHSFSYVAEWISHCMRQNINNLVHHSLFA